MKRPIRSEDIAQPPTCPSNSTAWALIPMLKSLLSRVVWMLLTATVAGLTMDSASMLGCGQSPDQQERVLESPIRTDIQLYSREFVIASRHAFGKRREFLASYSTFCAIWKEVSPQKPMMLKPISPAGMEPASKKVIPAINSPAVAVDAGNYTELLPLLKEIETLIIVGDGTGRGKLPYSGYEAEPAELELDDTAGAREAR
jgi:hypothetical protein